MRSLLTGKAVAAALLALMVSSATSADAIENYNPVTEDRLDNPEPHNWLQVRGNREGWGYSSLDQINASNVGSLQPAWLFSTGVSEGHQSPPLVNDGVMYVTTPMNQVLALDAATGKRLWRYQRELPEDLFQLHPTNRGPALLGDRLYVALTDCFLVALDARTGEVIWEVAVDDYQAGYYMTLAPLAAKGNIMVGVSGGEYGIRGYVAAYDAETGDEAWRTYTVPAPGEPGSDTWPDDDAWKTGGGSVWLTGNYDPETGISYWGIGNAAPWMGDTRGGMDNLYTTSVMALNVETGALVGHHQYHWNDSWDWDEVSPPLIYDVTRDGETFKALVNVARNGHIYLLKPTAEGPIEFVDAWDYVYSNVITAFDPDTGRVSYDNNHWPGTGKAALFCPSLWGGKDWPYSAYSPDTGLLYIPANENLCSTLEGAEEKYVPGELYIGVPIPVILGGFSLREGWDHIGEIQAWNVDTGEEVWSKNFDHQNWGPILATAGGVLFSGGTNDHMFRAHDAATGETLWEYPTNSGVTASPSTYSVDGKQYVAVQSGWGVDAERKQDVLRGIIPGYDVHVPQGGVIWVFALP
ncbi:MAG: PQQ-dependent dehydrogenase, methanol/ethanol family [Rhodospirillales bacterium]|nr:PQQ-dependent dehydrogenase, methanol/ethanol family [Rhodospirillales bacterium]